MASRTPSLTRVYSTTAQRISRQSVTPGMPLDTSSFTATGGSGADSTTLSKTFEEASKKTVAVYRSALRDIPAMRRNFSIMEDKRFLSAVIRENFERHRDVTDPKIIDMLVFKASQELREIREQWKSRHHIYSYIQRYTDKLLREELAHRASHSDLTGRREKMLADWRDRGLIPAEINTWDMFLHWKSDEDTKFRNFVLDNKLFSVDHLDRNKKASSSSCSVM